MKIVLLCSLLFVFRANNLVYESSPYDSVLSAKIKGQVNSKIEQINNGAKLELFKIGQQYQPKLSFDDFRSGKIYYSTNSNLNLNYCNQNNGKQNSFELTSKFIEQLPRANIGIDQKQALSNFINQKKISQTKQVIPFENINQNSYQNTVTFSKNYFPLKTNLNFNNNNLINSPYTHKEQNIIVRVNNNNFILPPSGTIAPIHTFSTKDQNQIQTSSIPNTVSFAPPSILVYPKTIFIPHTK